MKQLILDAGVILAARVGFRNVTRKLVATKAKCALATVSYHYGSMGKLHDAIIHRGIELGLSLIVAQGLAEGHEATKAIPVALRRRARRHAKLIVAL